MIKAVHGSQPGGVSERAIQSTSPIRHRVTVTTKSPRTALLGAAVLGALLAGCGSTAGAATTPAVTQTQTTDAAPLASEPPASLAPAAVATSHPVAKAATTYRPNPKPTTHRPVAKATTHPATAVVHPGAFCSPEGATGVTSKGTLMRCTRKAGDSRARWRAA